MIAPHMIAGLMDLAERINAACDARHVDAHARERAHRLHGDLIARGADSQDEVLRVIESQLDRDAQQELQA